MHHRVQNFWRGTAFANFWPGSQRGAL